MAKPSFVIYESADFIAVNKPAGLLTHRNLINSEPDSLADIISSYYPEMKTVGDEPTMRPGVVHRLDKDTSGVLIFARTNAFFDHLKKCFQSGEVSKTYIALVRGKTPKEGVIDVPIGLRPGTVKRSVTAKNMKMVKSAVTKYKAIEYFSFRGEIFTLLNVFPKTGRTHQIRVHMHSIHHEVVGDILYGKSKNLFDLHRHFLHAESIDFPLPSGSRIKIEAELSEDLLAVLEVLKRG